MRDDTIERARMHEMQQSDAVKHVVIIVKENHSFDNYFGTFPGADGDITLPHSPNPPPKDPPHDHQTWLDRATRAVRAQFTEPDIATYFQYARDFTLCDHYFTDVAGPSTPNHLMLIAADSPVFVNPHNYRLAPGAPLFTLPSLPANLRAAGHEWRNYGGYAFDFIEGLNGQTLDPARFAADAGAGNLPAVSWVYAPHELSEHAADTPADRAKGVGDVTKGMQWTADQVAAVVTGGLWPNVAIFITWDDWGGWADHVEPAKIEVWHHDNAHPDRDSNHPAWDGTQFRYGSRVGCLVLSPYAKRGHISKAFTSHVSLVKFCEMTFDLPPLNDRTKAADGMTDCFDFNQQPLPPP
jgi:phospholipase C